MVYICFSFFLFSVQDDWVSDKEVSYVLSQQFIQTSVQELLIEL